MGPKKNFRSSISFKFDVYLLVAILVLSSIGLLNLAGVFGLGSLFFKKQLLFFLSGFVVLFLTSLIDYRIFKNYSLPSGLFYAVSVFLLLLTLKSTPIRGITAWLHLPFGVSFETSEIVKLALIMFLARLFVSKSIINLIPVSAFYVALPTLLIFGQPDLGSALIMFLIWFSGILLVGLNAKQLFMLIAVVVLIFAIFGLFFIQPYQRARIASFFGSFSGERGDSYNSFQAKIAIGSGGLWGLGFGNGFQAKSGILPEAQADFALAALIEQFGLAGLALILFLYFVILNRLILIGTRAKDNFSRFFTFLFIAYFFSHIVINVGMNLGILPITGLPLPFLSYGGSYFISLMIGFGIIESIRTRKPQ